jgi:hypothetical protein
MAKAQAGFSGLPCAKCGEPGGVSLSLEDLETVSCGECSTDYTLSEVRDTIEQWALVLAWRDAAPPRRAQADSVVKLA